MGIDYVIVHVGFAIQRLDEALGAGDPGEFERLGLLEEEFGDGSRPRPGKVGGGCAMKYLTSSPTWTWPRGPGAIHAVTTRPWAIMEVCGGRSHSIIRHGIDQLLLSSIEMIHGPGCPVRDAPRDHRQGSRIAARPDVIFCSFGDMPRVPGSEKDLFRIKSEGGACPGRSTPAG